MSRSLFACIALLSLATPALAAVPGSIPSTNALIAQMDRARETLHDRLASPGEPALRIHAALARLTQLRDTAMSTRRIQGGILSPGQRERLSHRVAVATVAR